MGGKQTFCALRCATCAKFSVQLAKKSGKWACPVCGTRQSALRCFAVSDAAKDVRALVQQLNAAQCAAAEQLAEQLEAAATPHQGQDNSTAAAARGPAASAGAPASTSRWAAFACDGDEEGGGCGSDEEGCLTGSRHCGVFVTALPGEAAMGPNGKRSGGGGGGGGKRSRHAGAEEGQQREGAAPQAWRNGGCDSNPAATAPLKPRTSAMGGQQHAWHAAGPVQQQPLGQGAVRRGPMQPAPGTSGAPGFAQQQPWQKQQPWQQHQEPWQQHQETWQRRVPWWRQQQQQERVVDRRQPQQVQHLASRRVAHPAASLCTPALEAPPPRTQQFAAPQRPQHAAPPRAAEPLQTRPQANAQPRHQEAKAASAWDSFLEAEEDANLGSGSDEENDTALAGGARCGGPASSSRGGRLWGSRAADGSAECW